MNINEIIQKIDLLNEAGLFAQSKDLIAEYLKYFKNDEHFIKRLAEVEYKLGNINKAGYILNELSKISSDSGIIDFLAQIQDEIQNSLIKEKLITVSFIVKNEEKTLPKAIESVKSIADEIIVVDTGSTDSTVEIARSSGAELYFFNWIKDYSAARNISIKYATSKWILYLDADEELSESSIKIIRDITSNADETAGGFYCEIISEHTKDDGKIGLHSGKYPRLFRNIGYPLMYFFGKIHEQITPSLAERGYQMFDSKLIILHNGYAITIDEMREKVRSHINVLSEYVRQEPENGYTWYHLGNTLFQMGKYAESREVLENSLKCGNLSNFLSANTALVISRVYEHLGDIKSAFSWSHNALKYVDKFEPALIRKAEILQKIGRLDDFIKK